MATIRRNLEEGREAYERRSWRTAHEALSRARAEGPLEPDDLWRFALSSYLIGSEDDFLSALREAHQAHVDAGDLEAGARRCFWIGMHLANRADAAQASGWFQRAARLVQEAGRDCAERGYLLLPTGQRALGSDDPEAALRAGVEATRIARRFQDTDLLALALHLQGRALLRLGRVDEGLGLLDEAMVAVTADEPSPPVTGIVYCSVIAACREVWAVGRAHEWTDALSTWCERQPDMVPYTGECRVYRSEVLRLRGAWQDALDEARGATRRFAEGSIPDATGMALYQQAEVYRLRGEFAAAEEAYRAASRAGRAPDPGLALLRLAQGDAPAAAAALRRALAEASRREARARLLPALVEALLEAGEVDDAARACAALEELAGRCAPGVMEAMVTQARGSVALAQGEPATALPLLRTAWRAWSAFGAPYEAARARVLLARACRALGDEEGARLELDGARAELERLGARPDLARLDALAGSDGGRDDHGLTRRELEVIALLATGRTNRQVAEVLSISEKTVARHVANIFLKLGVSTRAAATAYAWEHGLVSPPT